MSQEPHNRGGKNCTSDDVLPGPHAPAWSCNCGQDGNWACRIVCRACGKSAPRSIADKARAAAQQNPVPSVPRQPQGSWAKGPPKQGDKQAAAEIRQVEDEIRALRADKEKSPTIERIDVCVSECCGFYTFWAYHSSRFSQKMAIVGVFGFEGRFCQLLFVFLEGPTFDHRAAAVES